MYTRAPRTALRKSATCICTRLGLAGTKLIRFSYQDFCKYTDIDSVYTRFCPTLHTLHQGDLAGRYHSAELQLSNLSERNAELSSSLSESEARARAACAKLDALEDAHEACKQALGQVGRV
jgi:hypothetical protein